MLCQLLDFNFQTKQPFFMTNFQTLKSDRPYNFKPPKGLRKIRINVISTCNVEFLINFVKLSEFSRNSNAFPELFNFQQ